MRSLVSIVGLASWRIGDSGTVVRLTTYTELAGWLPWLRQARPAQSRRGSRKAERNHKSASLLTFHNWVLFSSLCIWDKAGQRKKPRSSARKAKLREKQVRIWLSDQRGAPQFSLYNSHKGVKGSGEPYDLSAYIYGWNQRLDLRCLFLCSYILCSMRANFVNWTKNGANWIHFLITDIWLDPMDQGWIMKTPWIKVNQTPQKILLSLPHNTCFW